MTLIADVINAHLPARKKLTPSGWLSFNSVCCHHRGHRRDTKGRAGINTTDTIISYYCFNCGFKVSWQPGRRITRRLEQFLQWLGVPDDSIRQIQFDVLRTNDEELTQKYTITAPKFKSRLLPEGAKPITAVTDNRIVPVLEYMVSRNLHEKDTDYHWTPEMIDRLIIPFRYNKEIVGYTARSITEKRKPKYLTDSQPGYVFNLDSQPYDREWMIICEGPVDALHIDGVSLLGSALSEQQRILLATHNKNTLLVPDRDSKGKDLIEVALENNWAVSMPPWDDNIKDIDEAVAKYGRMLTLYSIMKYKYETSLKIKLGAKKWFI